MKRLMMSLIVLVLLYSTGAPAQNQIQPMLVLIDEVLPTTAWNMAEYGGTCTIELVNDSKAPSGNKVYKWTWNIPQPGYVGWGLPTIKGTFDLTPYLDRSALAFRVRGVSPSSQIGFKIEDDQKRWAVWRMGGAESPVNISPSSWKFVRLPLRSNDFKGSGSPDPSRVKQISFIGPPEAGKGEVYIDALWIIPVKDMNRMTYVKEPLLSSQNQNQPQPGSVAPMSMLTNAPKATLKQAYTDVILDDFSDKDQINNFGGNWLTFCAGETGDLVPSIVEGEPGNPAIQIKGILPDQGGLTWGGVFCDLNPNRSPTRDLRGFKALQFRIKTDNPGNYRIRIENPLQTYQSTNITFPVGKKYSTITIPLADFITGVAYSSTMTWTMERDVVGEEFHIIIDDVKFLH